MTPSTSWSWTRTRTAARSANTRGSSSLLGRLSRAENLLQSVIEPFSHVTFSASGREGTAVAPVGKVFYVNDQENLKIMVSWANAGWTTREAASAQWGSTLVMCGQILFIHFRSYFLSIIHLHPSPHGR